MPNQLSDMSAIQLARLIEMLRVGAEQDDVRSICALLRFSRYEKPANVDPLILPAEVEQISLVHRITRLAESGDEEAQTATVWLKQQEGMA